jgi:hypothetical protein
MVSGIRDLREAQIAFQATCAAPEVPTDRLVGKVGMRKKVNRVFPADPTGLMSSHIMGRHYDPSILCEVPFETGEEGLTFQQLPWFLAMGAVGGVTPVGGPPAYTWTFCPDLEDSDLPDVATIRYGDNAAVWESSCCFARQLVISGAAQGVWGLEADIIGRDMQNSYYSGAAYYPKYFQDLPYPTPLQTILGQMTSWYVDDTCEFAAAPTQRTGYLIDWKVTLPGFHPKFFQDGVLYYTTMGLASRSLKLEATVEFDDAYTKAMLWDGWINGTPLYQRLLGVGSALGATTYQAQIDMVTELESCETLDERDGNDIIKFTARSVYDVACDVPEWCIYVVNNEAGLP